MTGISDVVLRLFARYPWPGNVRELENVIERAVVLETSRTLSVKGLPQPIAEAAGSARAEDAGPEAVRPLDQVERTAILAAIDARGGNLTQAARALGIHRSTLFRKMQRHGLSGRG